MTIRSLPNTKADLARWEYAPTEPCTPNRELNRRPTAGDQRNEEEDDEDEEQHLSDFSRYAATPINPNSPATKATIKKVIA